MIVGYVGKVLGPCKTKSSSRVPYEDRGKLSKVKAAQVLANIENRKATKKTYEKRVRPGCLEKYANKGSTK